MLNSNSFLIPSRGLRLSPLLMCCFSRLYSHSLCCVLLGTMTTKKERLYLNFLCGFIKAVGLDYCIMGWNIMGLNTALLWLALIIVPQDTGRGEMFVCAIENDTIEEKLQALDMPDTEQRSITCGKDRFVACMLHRPVQGSCPPAVTDSSRHHLRNNILISDLAHAQDFVTIKKGNSKYPQLTQ